MAVIFETCENCLINDKCRFYDLEIRKMLKEMFPDPTIRKLSTFLENECPHYKPREP